MISLTAVKNQIVDKSSRKKIDEVRNLLPSTKRGVYARVLSDATLASDIRMYRREVFAYNGKYYEQLDSKLFTKVIIDAMADLKLGDEFVANNYKKVVDFCDANLIEKNIKPERHIIPFRNCLLNTQTMERMEHSPSHDILYCLDYDYVPEATCPKWEKFLTEVLPKDGLTEVLQEYLGLLFVDRDGIKLEKMLVLLGGGSNGKSVIFETITRILGDVNISTFEMKALTKDTTADYNIAAIDGKILNYSSELDPKDFSGDKMKKLISGESIMARQVYKDPILLKNIPLFICNANELPETMDKTDGFFRRLLIIPFEVTIEEKDQDKELSTKLRDEYSGILNWIIEGRKRILEQNIQFTKVTEIDRLKESYRMIQDSFYGFIKTNRIESEGVKTDRYFIPSKELYTRYCDYCHEAGKSEYGKAKFLQKVRLYKCLELRKGVDGFYIYCDRDINQHWNQDIGSSHDRELIYVEPEEREEDEWKQGKVPF